MTTQIYIAAPLFTQAERTWNARLEASLQQLGFYTILPQELCATAAFQGKWKEVFQTCKDGIDCTDWVVAILDGADADSGTCWECGYAFAKGVPIVGVRTDFRQSGDLEGLNCMLEFSCFTVIRSDVEDVARQIAAVIVGAPA